MDDRIYELLNGAKINLNEYEQSQLSAKEKHFIERKLLQEVKNMKDRDSKRVIRKGWKIAGVTAAACMAAVVIGSNSVTAKELLSNTFQKIIAGTVGVKDGDEQAEIYKKIGEKSQPVSTEQGSTVTEDAGVKIKVCDVFCDGYMLYYTLQLETDNPTLTGEEIDGITEKGFMGTIDGEETFLRGFQKQDDGTYTCVQSHEFFGTENPKIYNNGDIIPVELTFEQFVGWDYDNWEDSEDVDTGAEIEYEYVHTEPVEGNWKLSFPVTVDTSNNKTMEFNKEDNGIKLVSVTKTKATLNLVIEAPNFSEAPYNDPHNDPDMGIKGEDGVDLQWLTGYNDIKSDGTHVYHITLLDRGDTNLTLEVIDKTKENAGTQIAAIDFQIER